MKIIFPNGLSFHFWDSEFQTLVFSDDQITYINDKGRKNVITIPKTWIDFCNQEKSPNILLNNESMINNTLNTAQTTAFKDNSASSKVPVDTPTQRSLSIPDIPKEKSFELKKKEFSFSNQSNSIASTTRSPIYTITDETRTYYDNTSKIPLQLPSDSEIINSNESSPRILYTHLSEQLDKSDITLDQSQKSLDNQTLNKMNTQIQSLESQPKTLQKESDSILIQLTTIGNNIVDALKNNTFEQYIQEILNSENSPNTSSSYQHRKTINDHKVKCYSELYNELEKIKNNARGTQDYDIIMQREKKLLEFSDTLKRAGHDLFDKNIIWDLKTFTWRERYAEKVG